MDFSIVIPAFEESTKVARDIEAAAGFLQANFSASEIIVVDDGSRDRTAKVAEEVPIPPTVRCDVIRYEAHHGKGYAVRTGMEATTGDYVMFADCGLCIPYGDALLGLDMLKSRTCEIAHGSRRLIESDILQDQPWHRRLISFSLRRTVQVLLRIPRNLTDTQCGFKIYRGDVAREIYGKCIIDGFLFDVETILLAAQKGYRIREFPVEWACDPDSRLSVTRTPWPVLAELRTLRRAIKTSHSRSAKPEGQSVPH